MTDLEKIRARRAAIADEIQSLRNEDHELASAETVITRLQHGERQPLNVVKSQQPAARPATG